MPSFLELQVKYQAELAKLIETLSKDTIDRAIDDYKNEYAGERTRRAKSVGKRENKTVDTYQEDTATGEVTKSGTKTVITAKLLASVSQEDSPNPKSLFIWRQDGCFRS